MYRWQLLALPCARARRAVAKAEQQLLALLV